MKWMVLRETYVDEEVFHSIKKETWAPFEETKFGPSPSHAPSHELLGWLRERER